MNQHQHVSKYFIKFVTYAGLQLMAYNESQKVL